jgi:hypothetical protein
MKLTATMAMAAVMGAAAGTTAWAGERDLPNEQKAIVCMEPGTDIFTALRAQTVASKIFAEISVKIEWRRQNSCPAEALLISISNSTPADLLPGALAYALPYEGTHIVVFYDRVQKTVEPGAAPYLLGHVLAHEITHILQGVNRHSVSGVMKAHWESDDFLQMKWRPLGFTEEDVTLIHLSLDTRASRRAGSALIAANIPPR